MKTVEPGKAETSGGAYADKEGITLAVDAAGPLRVTFWYAGCASSEVELTLTKDELAQVIGPNAEVSGRTRSG